MSERRGEENWVRSIASDKHPATYYDVLDLDRDANAEEIKESYYKLARQYHPDAAENQEVAQRFALISEAYRILSDPQRRHQYDRTLPQKSYPLRHPTPEKVWREAADVVLIRSDRFGPLNQAMQSTIPITIDEDLLVLTMPGSDRHLAGHMETASHRRAILNALELVAGRRLEFRIIDGTTLEDWEKLKKAETKARQARETTVTGVPSTAPPGKAAEVPWDELMQRMHRHYQQLQKRQYPQTKAHFIREVLGWIARTDEETRFESEGSQDLQERMLARAIERLAAIAEIPPVLVALQYDAMKRAGEV